MPEPIYHLPDSSRELPVSLLLGGGFALALFILMALAQMMGEIRRSDRELDETVMAFNAPEIEEMEIEEAPPPPEEVPELEEEPPPQLSLDQLDLALNPGTGGSLAGDFSLPSLGSFKDEMAAAFVDFSQLDQTPRPIGVFGFNFPRRLLKEKAQGRIVLLLKLDPKGEVLDVEVDSSTLPKFNDFVLGEVKRWKFTPPTQQGRPVQALARLPIPITIN